MTNSSLVFLIHPFFHIQLPGGSFILDLEEPILFSFNKVPSMAVHRGDYYLPLIDLCSTPVTPAIWTYWVEYIISNPSRVSFIKSAGIEDAINASLHREIFRCKRDITRLCCRWAPLIHILFFVWGEETPVLEDVVALMGFPFHDFILIMRQLFSRRWLRRIRSCVHIRSTSKMSLGKRE